MSDTPELDALLAEMGEAAKTRPEALARSARRLAESIRELGKVARLPSYADSLARQAEDIAQALEAQPAPAPRKSRDYVAGYNDVRAGVEFGRSRRDSADRDEYRAGWDAARALPPGSR